MTRVVKELSDMEIDEISLVDRPANQHAKVVITKRASKEDTVPDIYNEDGEILDFDAVSEGDVVFDDEGQAFVVVDEEISEDVSEEEFSPVGKSLPSPEQGANVQKSFADELREELSKSINDIERDEVIAKALSQVDEMSKSLAEAEEIAKSERDLRLLREYTEVAKSYSVPVDADELAPVLMAIAEYLPYEYGEVIHKALSAAGEIFEEVGYQGAADHNDVLAAVDAYIDENVSKSDISKAGAVEAVFADNPEAYDEYMATRSFR